MLTFDLISDDIIEKILIELSHIRKKNLLKEFKLEWRNRRPYNRIILSRRNIIHEGRHYLEKNHKKINRINYQFKYWINGIPLYPIEEVRYVSYLRSQAGLSFKKDIYLSYQIQNRYNNNGWDYDYNKDHKKIIKFLINNEMNRCV